MDELLPQPDGAFNARSRVLLFWLATFSNKSKTSFATDLCRQNLVDAQADNPPNGQQWEPEQYSGAHLVAVPSPESSMVASVLEPCQGSKAGIGLRYDLDRLFCRNRRTRFRIKEQNSLAGLLCRNLTGKSPKF